MSSIYIVSNYGKLKKKGEVLQLFTDDGSIANTIFPYKTEQLIFMGKVEMTNSALKLLMKYNINTVFLSKSGKFNGKITFQNNKNIFLRMKQYELLKDEEFKLNFSKNIVKAKIKNQLTFLQRISRKKEKDQKLKEKISFIKDRLFSLDKFETLDQVRGVEGIVAREYFSVFNKAIDSDWAIFKRRSMHPPEDNVNAVLSFLYTLILFRVDAAIESLGLDSYAGFFHSLGYGKKSLAFDLMEEYRTPLADSLAIAMFNLGSLKEEYFRDVVFSSHDEDLPLDSDFDEEGKYILEEKKGVLLTQEGLKKVISQFEKKLNNEYFYPFLLKRINYKRLIIEQVKHFKKFLIGEEKEYKPLQIK
jgi:CRISP-associated protein Cas1